jgi:hypothetical protein
VTFQTFRLCLALTALGLMALAFAADMAAGYP